MNLQEKWNSFSQNTINKSINFEQSREEETGSAGEQLIKNTLINGEILRNLQK